MPVTKTKNAGTSKYADFLDATSDSESGTQSRRAFADAETLPDHESEEEISPSPANRGQTWKILSNLCGYRPRMAGEGWEHYCKRPLRKFGNALIKEATEVELEAVRLAMDKAEYAHLVLALDTTDYGVQPEERAGNWALSNTDLGNWGLKCIEADVDCAYTNSQHLSDGDCRLCSVVFVHCQGTGTRKRVYYSNTPGSIHSPSKKARTVTEHHSSPEDGELLSEVKDLRHQLEAQWKTQEVLENDKSVLEKEVLAPGDLVGRLLDESEADKKALRVVKMAIVERAKATESKKKVGRGHE
ncbi:hypothetical protein IW262DRAFT_1483403 [Armillaria fumosa]|nr:hypothetical protein IW262DRAFT_1483403 [Armillaria fumosa]